MSEAVRPGVLYVVSTPIGNLEDISQRAIRILKDVDIVAAEDTRTTGRLLKHLGLTKKLLSYHNYNEARRAPQLLALLNGGKSIGLVTDAGTPGISDPAFEILRLVIENGITVVPIPGANAVLPALVVSGLPLHRFVFEGFLPVKKGRATRLERLKTEERTIVLYESPHRIVKTVNDIRTVLGERRITVARELTKKFEEVVRGTVSEVLTHLESKGPKGEYVIVIAGVNYETGAERLPNN
ncbi:MAG TPA: 16S rRNA (cytidine(1402)-2'-O)-methyltransferase [Bacteroidota bacterium]